MVLTRVDASSSALKPAFASAAWTSATRVFASFARASACSSSRSRLSAFALLCSWVRRACWSLSWRGSRRGFGLLQLRVDGIQGGGLPLRNRLHRLRADGTRVAGLEALANREGGVVAVRLLPLGSGVSLGLFEGRERLLLQEDGLPGFVHVSSRVGDGLRRFRVALLQADQLVGEGPGGDEGRVAGFVEAVGLLLRLELVQLLVERLLRLAGSVECRLGSLSAGGFVRVVFGQARLVLSVRADLLGDLARVGQGSEGGFGLLGAGFGGLELGPLLVERGPGRGLHLHRQLAVDARGEHRPARRRRLGGRESLARPPRLPPASQHQALPHALHAARRARKHRDPAPRLAIAEQKSYRCSDSAEVLDQHEIGVPRLVREEDRLPMRGDGNSIDPCNRRQHAEELAPAAGRIEAVERRPTSGSARGYSTARAADVVDAVGAVGQAAADDAADDLPLGTIGEGQAEERRAAVTARVEQRLPVPGQASR